MLRALLASGAAALALTAAADAYVFVVGENYASVCYQHTRAGNYTDDAIEDCNDALTRDVLSARDRASTFVNRGVIHLKRGNIDSAWADFNSAVATDPTLAEGYLNRGAVFMRRNDYSSALREINAGLERSPDNLAQAYLNRGVAHEETGNVRAAYQDYRRAADLAPNWDEPRTELARFRVQ